MLSKAGAHQDRMRVGVLAAGAMGEKHLESRHTLGIPVAGVYAATWRAPVQPLRDATARSTIPHPLRQAMSNSPTSACQRFSIKRRRKMGPLRSFARKCYGHSGWPWQLDSAHSTDVPSLWSRTPKLLPPGGTRNLCLPFLGSCQEAACLGSSALRF